MSVTAVSMPPDENAETVDFLRRLASMMSGGKNAEMLLGAASMIEALAGRAMTAERLCSEQQDEREKSNELRQVAEIAADNLNSEIASLKAQLAEVARQAEIDRASFAEEEHRLSTKAEDAEARLAKVNVELDELRTPFAELSDTVVAVPTEQLRLVRAQFDFLADGFAKNGDVISQTICEIGRCAIEHALTGSEPARESN
jgi:chromosome segregation ATPase